MSALCDHRDRDSILRDLKSSDEEVRRLAVARVGTIGVEESIPLLVEGLGDSSWRVRKASVERLIFSGSGVLGGHWPAPDASCAHRSRGAACREMANA